MQDMSETGGVPGFTICDRLRKARERTGMDQAEFAQRIGVSRGTVSTYERDEHAAFKPIVLRAWAEISGVPLGWIETGVCPNVPRQTPDGGAMTARMAHLAALVAASVRPKSRHLAAA